MTEDKIHASELAVDTMTVEKVEAKTTNIDTGGGVMVDGFVKTEGGKFIGRDAIDKANSPSQVVSFISPDNAILWTEITKLVRSLDDLPNRVGKLEVVYKPATEFEKLIIRLLMAVVAAVALLIGGALFEWNKSRKRHWWQ